VHRRGRKYLRLDCRDQAKIRRLYENTGFELRDIGLFGDSIFCRYEIDLTQSIFNLESDTQRGSR
jgi:hypothetical protein